MDMLNNHMNSQLFITNWSQPKDFWHKNDEYQFDLLRFDNNSFFSRLKNIIHLRKVIDKYNFVIVKGFVYEVFFLLLFYKPNSKLFLVELGLANKLSSNFKTLVLKSYLKNFILIQSFTPKIIKYLKYLSPKSDVYWDLLSTKYDDSVIPTYRKYLENQNDDVDKKFLSAGRTYRDYNYLINELDNFNVKIIGYENNDNNNSSFEFVKSMPYKDFYIEIVKCKALIVPLVNTDFSIGMRVIQIAMSNSVPVFFSRIDDNYEYFKKHDYYNKISFKNNPGDLRLIVENFKSIYNEELVRYNYEYALKNYSSSNFIKNFNSKIKKYL